MRLLLTLLLSLGAEGRSIALKTARNLVDGDDAPTDIAKAGSSQHSQSSAGGEKTLTAMAALNITATERGTLFSSVPGAPECGVTPTCEQALGFGLCYLIHPACDASCVNDVWTRCPDTCGLSTRAQLPAYEGGERWDANDLPADYNVPLPAATTQLVCDVCSKQPETSCCHHRSHAQSASSECGEQMSAQRADYHVDELILSGRSVDMSLAKSRDDVRWLEALAPTKPIDSKFEQILVLASTYEKTGTCGWACCNTDGSMKWFYWGACEGVPRGGKLPTTIVKLPTYSLGKASNRIPWAQVNPCQYVYVMVRGLLTQLQGAMYMMDNQQAIKDLGCEVRFADHNTGQTVVQNGAVIAEYIKRTYKETNKKVVLFAHSKGVPDMLHSLATNKDIWPMVHRVVALQGVVGGTPIAQDPCPSPTCGDYIKHPVGFMLKLLLEGSTFQSVLDLKYTKRKQWFQDYGAGLTSDITKKILSIATDTNRPTSTMAPARLYMQKFYNGLESDGLVPQASMMVPGSYSAKVLGMDHTDPVMPGFSFTGPQFAKYTSYAFTLAAVYAALAELPN